MKIRTIAGLAILLGLAACKDGKAPAAGGTAPEAALSDARTTKRPEIDLAESPVIDLLANRYRWHLYRDGLVVPFASEGFRKYTQEYKQPWGRVTDHDGRAGRILEQRAAELTIPWEGTGAATARVWVHGRDDGQRVQLDVNGKRAGVVAAPAEWTELTIAIPDGLLAEGENRLRIHVAKAGRVLFHALELVPGEAAASGTWPPLSPVARSGVAGTEKEGLAGFTRMVLPVEVPPRAWLRADLGAAKATFRITARATDGTVKTLLETERAGSWKAERVSLAEHAGALIALEIAIDGDGAVAAPAIALEAAPVRTRPAPYDNVILVVVDALRSDRLALYGKTRVATPRTTAEAERRGAVFLYNQAASPSSPPSHGSIQTGMIPRVHGVVGDSAQLAAGTPMVSTQLGAAGVATAYYGNNPFGMARLERPGKWTEFHQTSKEGKGIDCTALVPEMLDFAKRQHDAGKRFFISSLPYEPHTPYRYHEGITDKYHDGPWGPPVGKNVNGDLITAVSSGRVKLSESQLAQYIALYDGEVEYWDSCFAMLLDGLEELGVSGKTAVVLTSDHGEGMYEHGRGGHAFGHFAELGDVPFVIYGDGLVDELTEIEVVTSHLDITPTILDLMGVTPDEKVQGISVLPLLLRDGRWTPRVVPLEYGRSYSLRAKRWKLIVDYGGDESVYDLETDPTEQKNLAGKSPLAERYLRDLAGFFLAHRSKWRMASWGPLNDHTAAFVEYVESERP